MDSVVGTSAEHYQQLGLTEGVVAPWEDGLRTDPDAESFEWWYLDGVLSDGSKLTVEFHTKPPYVSPSEPLTPFVSLTLDRPDGTNITRTLTARRDQFECSHARCDVRVDANTFRGDLRAYEIHVEIDDLVADLHLQATLPPWRPATGHVFFGEKLVAWLPAVPRGVLSGTLALDGTREHVDGVGYHDHNWGTAPLRKLVDHWYWGRARISDYTIVTLNFISHADYGRRCHPALMVAKSGEVLAAVEDAGIEFAATDIHTNEATGSPVADTLSYEHEANGSRYVVRFERERDVLTLDFGKAGAYHRFVGQAVLERHADGALVERISDDALWELLDFRPRSTRPHEHASAGPALAHKA
jgi:predicted secreted hydrolase